MNLTPAQIQTLKNGIAANATANAFPNTSDGNFACAAYLNTAANPVTNVWNTNVLVMPTLNAAIHWPDFNVLTAPLSAAYMAMTQSGSINMADKNVAAGLVGHFGETPPTTGIFVDASASSVAIRAASIRPGTYFEVMFSAVGTGTLSTANVCVADAGGLSLYGQLVDYQTVTLARNS